MVPSEAGHESGVEVALVLVVLEVDETADVVDDAEPVDAEVGKAPDETEDVADDTDEDVEEATSSLAPKTPFVTRAPTDDFM